MTYKETNVEKGESYNQYYGLETGKETLLGFLVSRALMYSFFFLYPDLFTSLFFWAMQP